MLDFFFSDPHFHHKNIIKHAKRPFYSLEDMELCLIERYKETVGPTDHVWWLGDCSWSIPYLQVLLPQLPGRKSLVIGNHDKGVHMMSTLGFEVVTKELYVDLDGIQAIVSHYPPWSEQAEYEGDRYDDRFKDRRPKPTKNQVVIHGHTHEHTPLIKQRNGGYQKRVHVGVDAWDFRPAPFQEVVTLAHKIFPNRRS